MVMVPEVPTKMVVPPVNSIAVGTLLRTTFSTIRLPPVAGEDDEVYAVMMPIGVFVMVLSIKVMDPTSCELVPPAEMSIPFWQLLMLIPWYTHPQLQSWLIAVTQLLKTRFRMVNC